MTRQVTTVDNFASGSDGADGVAVHSLEPGTTLVVQTRNSRYRLVILIDRPVVVIQGGRMFPEPTVVRLEGATAGGSALKTGWILVGFQMEMSNGSIRIRSSPVRSVSVGHVRLHVRAISGVDR